MIVWMVGEYNSLGDIIPRMVTTVLKYLARCFTSEELETKLQICNTTVKVLRKTIVYYMMSSSICMSLVLRLFQIPLAPEYFYQKVYRNPLLLFMKILLQVNMSMDLGV